ncbi:hypothetical protein NEOLEDRAFT_1127362 [Neolentinus lepideus HHB14362 ss-1]|uniref:G-protein coupled receptors family 1 profile domain-containing protein n=1 Tax=Neolentinus lepideus HHB14362 ss-1 TaxID=1314782 RepID=A0A165VGE9_9AGAM|nr:hypothetical protein NEOLEDRAFT_1127362 [Neolentinus lepideus HHB14362 ss-1]
MPATEQLPPGGLPSSPLSFISFLYSSSPGNTSSDFVWTSDKQTVVVWTGVAPTIFSLVAAIVVLTLAGVIWLNPLTRPSLSRQSLQMLLWVQVMSLIYSGTYLGEMLITGPTKWCNAVIILTLFASNFIDFVVMLIPINLQLALVHGLHTEGFVRWYLLGSLFAAIITALPGSVKNVWGWDPEALICWISLTSQKERNAWEIGAFYAWILISMIVASISTCIVLIHLLTYTRGRRGIFSMSINASSVSSNGKLVRSVAWRIILYPIVLIVANCISAAANFSITLSDGINSEATYVVWATSGFMYGIVPGAYALITLFVDPSFSRALRNALTGREPTDAWDHSVEMSSTQRKPGNATHTQIQIEFTTQVVTDIGDGGEYVGTPDSDTDNKKDLETGNDSAIVLDGVEKGTHEGVEVEFEGPETSHGVRTRRPIGDAMFQRRFDTRSRLKAEINQL